AVRVCALLSALLLLGASHYLYRPLPDSVAEPYKLMMLDAVLRTANHVATLGELLGLVDPEVVLRNVVPRVPARSDAWVTVHDTELGGVRVRVFVSSHAAGLKRGVIYLHGGGWAYGTTR
uniref:Alpha/beta hydrolase fold-3 domain-containing protein n=1 Tax=Petromyzon marinus TaxID=7757 RepID=S4RSA5_PETMA